MRFIVLSGQLVNHILLFFVWGIVLDTFTLLDKMCPRVFEYNVLTTIHIVKPLLRIREVVLSPFTHRSTSQRYSPPAIWINYWWGVEISGLSEGSHLEDSFVLRRFPLCLGFHWLTSVNLCFRKVRFLMRNLERDGCKVTITRVSICLVLLIYLYKLGRWKCFILKTSENNWGFLRG